LISYLLLLEDIDHYKNYINNEEVDPVQEMEEYKKNAKYGVSVADLILPILSRLFNIKITILHQRKEDGTYLLENENHIITHDSDNKSTMSGPTERSIKMIKINKQ
jgi:hypothetical protein